MLLGCVCDTGWTGDNCDIDIDECSEGLQKCAAANTKCLNKAGGAVCICMEGYTNVSNKCIGKVVSKHLFTTSSPLIWMNWNMTLKV